MSSKELKELLSKNPQMVIDVLETIGYHSFWQYKSDEYRGAIEGASNKTSVSVMLDSLYITDFARNIKGDIFQFVGDIKGYTFKESYRYVLSVLGISSKGEYKKKKDVLSHFKKVKVKNKEKSIHDIEIKTFPKTIMRDYVNLPHYELLKEHITPKIQQQFGIAYDEKLDRILFPHYHYDDVNRIVGITGRTLRNSQEIKAFGIPKYWNYIKGYAKNCNLYALSMNLESINANKIIVLFEGEKSVLKEATMRKGKGYSVALGSHDLSFQQSQIILEKTNDDVEVCVGYDKDVQTGLVETRINGEIVDYETFLRHQMRYISPFRKVTYICDKHNLLDEKDSPVDKGIKKYLHLEKFRKEL